MYAVIDTDGALTVHPAPADSEAIRAAVGGWFDLVRLKGNGNLFAFVNDTGHVTDPPLPRNPIGSAVLVLLGGTSMAYAGPVVITGWDEHGEPTEVTDLSVMGRTTVELAHGTAKAVHDGRSVAGGPWSGSDDWEALADYMRWVVASPPPVAGMYEVRP